MEKETIDLYIVDFGGVKIPTASKDASRALCKAIEALDPYGGIPFVYHRSHSHLEALSSILEMSKVLGLELIKSEI